jgi:hypothetical protein
MTIWLDVPSHTTEKTSTTLHAFADAMSDALINQDHTVQSWFAKWFIFLGGEGTANTLIDSFRHLSAYSELRHGVGFEPDTAFAIKAVVKAVFRDVASKPISSGDVARTALFKMRFPEMDVFSLSKNDLDNLVVLETLAPSMSTPTAQKFIRRLSGFSASGLLFSVLNHVSRNYDSDYEHGIYDREEVNSLTMSDTRDAVQQTIQIVVSNTYARTKKVADEVDPYTVIMLTQGYPLDEILDMPREDLLTAFMLAASSPESMDWVTLRQRIEDGVDVAIMTSLRSEVPA